MQGIIPSAQFLLELRRREAWGGLCEAEIGKQSIEKNFRPITFVIV